MSSRINLSPKFIEIDGMNVHYRDEGEGMVIVNLKKGLTLREIKKDSIIDPYVQELKQDITS